MHFQILAAEKMYAEQTQSAAARITRLPAPVPLVFTVIPLRNRVAFEYRACARIRRSVLVNICASRDYVNASAPIRAIARRANVARTAFASKYVIAIVTVCLENCVSMVRAKRAAPLTSGVNAMKCASTTSAGIVHSPQSSVSRLDCTKGSKSYDLLTTSDWLPLRCSHGFIAGPDHCLDINECEDHPCHPSADCINLHGSYRCTCPSGTAGDPAGSGCVLPHQCTVHPDCPDTQACIQHNCSDPCSFVDCGLNTICSVLDHTASCQCQPGYIGDASGCFKVECLSNSDCPTDKYCNQEINKCNSKLCDCIMRLS